MKRRLVVLIVVSLVAAALSCSDSNRTKVTIYLPKNGQAMEQKKYPLIDSFLMFFSGKAYAQLHQPGDTAFYFLYVTASDIDTVYLPDIPGTETSIEIEVPTGSQRVFTLMSFSPNGNYNYIGQAVADLTGGDMTIPINMYPVLNNISVFGSGGSTVEISWEYDPTLDGKFSNIRIDRACFGQPTCDGSVTTIIPSTPIGSCSAVCSGSYSDSTSLVDQAYYYYFLSVDPVSFTSFASPSNFIDFFTNNYFIAVYMMGADLYLYNP